MMKIRIYSCLFKTKNNYKMTIPIKQPRLQPAGESEVKLTFYLHMTSSFEQLVGFE